MPKRLFVRLFASTAAIALGVGALAQAPQDPVIVSGGVTVSRQGSNTVVTQSTNRGVVDWRSFSIGPQESVRFDQPGRSSVTLNRVTGSELSRIDGQLSATGQVWLANPNGVLIGPGGRVNVSGLAATTGRVDVQEFLRSGKLAIDRIPSGTAIRNDGAISIAEGGYAALAAASIKNKGVITARAGSIALGSGKAMLLDFHGDRLIQFQVTEALDQAPIDAEALIDAEGPLVAVDGQVQLSARAAKGVIDNAINLKGHVIANQVRVNGGTVVLGDGGAVRVSGRIDASNPQGKGGSVAVLGEAVGLMDGASIDASGAKGGGEALIGGDWQGRGGQNAAVAYVAPTATIKADAQNAGDGGKVVVWADDSTRFNGSISARGAGAGAGGQVETSGKRALDVGAAATVTVAGGGAGKPGAWLLDPTDITISATGTAPFVGGVFDPLTSSSISTATISAGLATGDVTIKTSTGTGGAGDIKFTDGTITHGGSTARTLALLADRNITMAAGARINLTGAAHNVTFNSGASGATQATVNGGISLSGSTITTEGGAISMVGGQGGSLFARPTAGMNAGIGLSPNTLLDAGMGTVTLRGIGNPNATATAVHGVSLSGAEISAEGGISIKGFSGASSDKRGLGVWVYQTNLKATGAGGILIEGTALGLGELSRGVQFQTNAENKRIEFGTGGLTVIGVASSKGGGAGVQFESSGKLVNPLVITGSGPVSMTGTGGGVVVGGELNSGISFATGSPTLQSTGGNITLTGTAGLNAPNNIQVGSKALIRTVGGNLTLDGSGSAGGVLINAGGQVTTDTGTISILAKGSSGTNNGVQIGVGKGVSTGTVTATGAGGRILINGQSTGPDTGVTLDRATISAVDGPVVIEADKLSVTNNATLSSGAKTVIRPNELSRSIGVQGGAGDLQVTAATLARISGPVEIGRTNGTGLITVAKDAKLLQNTELITTGGVKFLGAVDGDTAGARSLTVSAGTSTVSFDASVGATTSLSTLTVTGGEIRTGGAAQFVTTGAQSYVGSTLLSGSTTFKTTNSDVSFAGSVDGTSFGQALTATLGTGTIGFANGAGANTALGSLTVGAARIAGTIVTVGAQSYGSAVATADVTLRRLNGAISFSGTLDGPGAVRLENGTGATVIGGAVGATTRLGSLTQVGTGQLTVRGQVRTDGSQSYAGSVVVADNTSFDATSGDITFSGGLNGTTAGVQSVTMATAGGAAVLPVGAGAITALASLTAGATRFAGAITTIGAQSYGQTMATADVTLRTTDSLISFSGALDGPGAVRLENGTGATVIGGAVGATTRLGSLTQLGTGQLTVRDQVRTDGSQSYAGSVVVADNTTFDATTGDISFGGGLNGTTDGDQSVTLTTAGGAAALPVGAGAITALASLTAGATRIAGTITTTGAQSYLGAALLTGPATFKTTNSDLSFAGSVDGTTVGQTLTASLGTGTIGFANGAGATTALDSLTVGAARIAGTIATVGAQSYGLTVATADATLRTKDSSITFSGALDGPGAVRLENGTGDTSFGGAVGATTRLGSLTQVGTGQLTARDQVRTLGSQSFAGSVVAATNLTFDATSGDITFSGGLNGTTKGGQSVTLATAGGTAQLPVGAGAITALASLTAGATRFAGAITTIGAQSYGQAMATADVTLRTTDAAINFSGALDGPGAVRLENGTGATVIGGAVGATTRLGSLTQVGTGQLTVRDQVRTDGSQSYAGSVVVADNTTFDATTGDISFGGGLNGTTDGGQSVTLTTTGGAAALPVGAGAITALANLTAGATRIAGTIATTGAQSYVGAALLTGPATFKTTNSDVSFTSSVDGATVGQTLTASLGTGTIGFANGAGATTALDSLTVGAARIAGTIATVGAQSYGLTVATADATLRTKDSSITFSGALDGPGAVRLENGTGDTSFGGAVGATTRLGSLTQVGTGQLTARDQVRTLGSQSFAGSVVAATNLTFDSTSGDITFGGGLNGTTKGGQSVTLATAGGTAQLPVGAGAITALASLTAGATRFAGTITTIGAQSYGQTVATADTILRATDSLISFSGALDGPGGVRLENGTGDTSFGGAVGATTRLGSLTQVGTGQLTARDQVRTLGSQSFAGSVVAATNLTFDATSGDITFSGGLNGTTDGDQSVTLATAGGAARLPVGAGAITALASLTMGAARIAGTITTTGAQSYGQTVATADTILRATDSMISFSGALDGPGGVRLENGTGDTSFGGAVGATTRLGSLTQVGTGQLTVRDQVRTDGSQSYAGSVVVANNTTFDATTGDISFGGGLNGTTDGGQSVTLATAGGTAQLPVGAGAITALASLTAGAARVAGTIATTGTQSYGGSVLLSGPATFQTTNSDVSFAGSVDGATVGQTLTASLGTGTIGFANGAGATTALDSLTVGAARIAGTIATTGAQSYGETVATADATLRTTNAAITFSGALDGPGAVRLENGAGATSLGGAVGALTRLASLTQVGTGKLTARDQVRTDGSQSFAGSVVVETNTSFDATTGDIAFGGGLNGTTHGGQSVTLATAGGTARLPVGAGAITALASLTAAAARIAGTITTTGAQSYGQTVATADATLRTTDAPITFSGALDGPGGVRLENGAGTTLFGGAVGALTRLATLTQVGSGQVTASDQVRTVGSQSYAGAVVLAADTSFDATNGDIAFDSELNGTSAGGQAVSFSTGPTGTVRLAAGAGRTTTLASLSAGAARIAGTVATTGAQSYTGSVVLSGAVQLNTGGGDVTFKEAVNGATNGASLNASTGAGTISFAKGLGSVTQLASLSVGAAAVGKTIWTVGTQEYSVIMLMEDATLRTSDAAIKVAGAIDGPGGLTLEAGAGAVSLAGAVGVGTRVASFTQTGSGPLTVTDSVFTDGAQSYAGPVILGGSTVFDALNGVIDFSAGLDGSTVGGQSARINVDGGGRARLPVGAGATTALASLSLYHGPNSTYAAAEIGGTVSTIGAQRYDAVTLLSDVTLSTNNAPVYFDYSLDGPNKLKVSAGGAEVTLPPLFVTPVPIDRVGVGRVFVPSLPSFGTRPSQQSVAASGTSPSVASQPSRPSGPGSPGDTPVLMTLTTPTMTSSPTFGSAPSVATMASQPPIVTAKSQPPFVPTLTNRGELPASVPSQQLFVGAPPMGMTGRLIKLMRDFAPDEEEEISSLDLTQSALNADDSFDRTDPARPGPTIKFTITSKPLR